MVSGKVTSEKTPKPTSSKIKAKMNRKGVSKKNKVESNAIVIAEKSPTMEKAEEVAAKLPSKSKYFVKLMLKSIVSGGFWLGLPSLFCNDHMPKKNETVYLVDESDEKFKSKYLKAKNGLSGGWGPFSRAHELLEGDVLIFHLVEQWTFKVYIVRAKELHPRSEKRLDAENHIQPKVAKHLESRVKQEVLMNSENHVKKEVDMEPSSESYKEINASDSVDFKDFKCIDDFKIVADGINIDPLFLTNVRVKYYHLCSNKKSYLHQNILKDLNYKLTVGIIRACRMTSDSCRSDLFNWDITLKGFEEFGFEVRFLRERIHTLVELMTRKKSKESTITSKLAEKQTTEMEMQTLFELFAREAKAAW